MKQKKITIKEFIYKLNDPTQQMKALEILYSLPIDKKFSDAVKVIKLF